MSDTLIRIAKTTAWAAGAGVAGALALKYYLRNVRWFPLEDKVFVITGGSRGLGLELARQLAQAGARVAICARTEKDLMVAAAELEKITPHVLAKTCDVREPEQINAFVEHVIDKWNRIDVLINNAGVIEVGPLDSMQREDFQQAMDTHCWGPLQMVQAVLPQMRAQGWGRIVNVASLGGKRAVPHMLPYAASKFALVGLSTGLRTELAKENILVTTVCPGLMRTGSPRNALFKGQHRKEYAWFSIGDSLPLVSLNAGKAAEKIIRAAQHGEAEVIITGPGNLAVALQTMAPNLMTELFSLIDRILPEMGGIGQQAVRGYQSESKWSPSWLTKLGDEAARRNNEMAPRSNGAALE